MNPEGRKIVIIGAGPMGLYAAYAAARRNLDVTVLERDRIGESLMTWGGARFFSPLEMNVPAEVRAALPGLPAGDALLTGAEFVEKVLLPLSRLPLLYDRIRLRHRVAAVGRAGLSREDFPGHPVRHEKPFRLLVETSLKAEASLKAAPEGATVSVPGAGGGEYLLDADFVFDATGVYGLANAFGPGGLPVPGERALANRVLRRLGELEAFLSTFTEGRILLVGHGHSAAHALLALCDAVARNPGISVTWSFRSRNLRPFREAANDPLPQRAAVVSAANALATAPPAFLDIRRGASVASLERTAGRASSPTAGIRASFTVGPPVEIDKVAAFTGYRPDLSFLTELALDLSPATQGSRRLHAILTGANDCLSVPMPNFRDLDSGEPGFHLLGCKSYGRSNTFLLRDGITHMEMIFKHVFA